MDPKLLQIFIRLEEDRNTLFTKLDTLNENQLTFKPGENKWSITEIVHHLVLSEQGAYRYMCKKNLAESLPQLGWTAAFRSVTLNFGMKLPLKYKAPRRGNIQPTGDVSYQQLKQEWQEVRENLRQFVEAFPAERMQVAIFRHPFTGYLTITQAFRFFEAHLKHHLKQIERIQAAGGFTELKSNYEKEQAL